MRWSLVRCADCRSAWLDPRPTRETIARAYRGAYVTHRPPQLAGEVDPTRRTARLRQALLNGYLQRSLGYGMSPSLPRLSRILTLIPGARGRIRSLIRDLPAPRPNDRVLDVGCGNGEFLLRARRFGWPAVAGVEPDEDARAHATEAGVEARAGLLDEATFPPGSFSALTLGHVIEHVHDPGALLAACRSVLRPGGLIWIATPNLDAGSHRALGRDWLAVEAPRHLALFTRASLTRAVRAAGFVDVAEPPPLRQAHELLRAGLAVAAGTYESGAWPHLTSRRRAAAIGWEVVTTFSRRFAEDIILTARAPG